MDQQRSRTDVTSKVYGKMDQGSMSLYLNKDKIGKIVFTNQGNLYEMSEGFEFDQEKVYRQDSNSPNQNKQLVDDCEFGWC
ncbi:YusG family protein [Alkalihalobacillus sp. AL-G]|uniref:YusG family protein n=1 Tax=Alkalihalobacillus sp. AL-G TaxID=2926399 RepID=UPI00272BCA94|nr:YusG family protein [Alkalihalobacillus sp. AL-G]WLD92728.1 YusG family protein [Alkalihalobacillus sp. AL-G]